VYSATKIGIFKIGPIGLIFFGELFLNEELISKIVQSSEIKAIAPQIIDILGKEGYRLIRARKFGGRKDTMQFMVERKDLKAISLEDCTKLSKYISTILDIENPFKNKYYLEVSSPGLERPLIELSDFKRYRGNVIKIKINTDKMKKERYTALLVNCENQNLIIIDKDTGKEISIPYESISDAYLVPEYDKLARNKKSIEEN